MPTHIHIADPLWSANDGDSYHIHGAEEPLLHVFLDVDEATNVHLGETLLSAISEGDDVVHGADSVTLSEWIIPYNSFIPHANTFNVVIPTMIVDEPVHIHDTVNPFAYPLTGIDEAEHVVFSDQFGGTVPSLKTPWVPRHGIGDALFPSLEAQGYGGATAVTAFPMLEASASGTLGVVCEAAIEFPMFTGMGLGGWNAAITLPKLSAEASGMISNKINKYIIHIFFVLVIDNS